MLLENERHQRFHSIGPVDCNWGLEKPGFIGSLLLKILNIFSIRPRDVAVSTISITRSTIDNEQVTVTAPIFAHETREQMWDRIGMLFSIPQERQEDANQAWIVVSEKEKERREEEKKLLAKGH